VTLDRLGEAELVPPEQALDFERVTVPRALVAPVLSGAQLPAATWDTRAERFQLLDDNFRLLAVAHTEAGRTVYDRVFPELGGRGSGALGA
jgi:hypothetical protein